MKKYIVESIPVVVLLFIVYALQAQTDDNFYEFTYQKDDFSEEALLDLRFLNEDVAGSHGFVKLSDDGNSFVFEDGTPVRWWAANGGNLAKRFNDRQLAYFARFLAKQGVNMIRFHGSINPAGKGTQIYQVDTAEVNDIWRMVAAMKKEGIYSAISPFWAHNGHMGDWVPEEWGIDGYSGNDALWGVMFFNDRLKNAYKTWVKYLYTEVNPHTGIALKDDPAVGLIQIKNEDGLFFWTMQNIKPELKTLITEQFAQWLIVKYGSLDKAYARWNNLQLPGDKPADNIMDIYITYEMTQDQQGAKALRMADQVEFFAYKQYDFYKEITGYYKNELDCKQLVNANNWKTASPPRLNDLERYTYSAADVVAVNRYYDPEHEGEHKGWRIDPGHYYVGASVLHHPDKLPINIKQLEGMPHLVTESGWNTPHRYMAEGPFLISAYQSLTGVDGFYWFFPTAPGYDDFPYFDHLKFDDGQYAMNRWTASLPGIMGMFPANALTYRMGYIQKGEPVVEENRSFKELWQRKIPVITEEAGFDPNRDDIGMQTQETEGQDQMLSPLVYLAGPVVTDFNINGGKNIIDDEVFELIRTESKKVTSTTGELEWDYEDGICVMNSPKSKGVAGFLDQKGAFNLDDLVIESDNRYAAINVVSMDQENLNKSKKILIQVGTVYQPTDWKEKPATFDVDGKQKQGYQILNTGKMPWRGEVVKTTITLKNENIKEAILLSSAGYKEKSIPLQRKGDEIILALPSNAMYIILQ